jgi:hypothetical protein
VDIGRIYHFELDENRTGFNLQDRLLDKVADSDEELNKIFFAVGFGAITDLEIGPDGYLYFVGYDQGKVYTIVPTNVYENILPNFDLG